MTDTQDLEEGCDPSGEDDLAMEALSSLSEAAQSSIEELQEVQEKIDGARRHRRRGWSWRRITANPETRGLLPSVSAIAVNLSGAGARFRRSLATSLRSEGVRTTEIAELMGVTRQRVSSLTRTRNGR